MNRLRLSAQNISLLVCIGIVIICLLLTMQFAGLRFEENKTKQFAATLCIVFFMRFILWEHVELFLTALLTRDLPAGERVRFKEKGDCSEFRFNPMDYLKLRLKSAKAELSLPRRHKNEKLNVEYMLLTKDLCQFGSYFILVLIVIVYSRNGYEYFNSKTMKAVLIENRQNEFGLHKMMTINDVYAVVNQTFSQSLFAGVDYNGKRLQEAGWMNLEIAKLIGVVRLKQIRFNDKPPGMTKAHFSVGNHLPNWRSYNRTLYYMEKYWRTYYPWQEVSMSGIFHWFLTFSRFDTLYTYSNCSSFVVLLARDEKNNQKILKFLKDNNWLDTMTAAVFIDFVLYNADGNVFSVISILVEQTPFGNVIWKANLESVVLLNNLDELGYEWWILAIFYFVELLSFCKVLACKYWFSLHFFKSPWNCVDLTMVLLNVIIISLLWLRDAYVTDALSTLEYKHKLEFMDFSIATNINYLSKLMMGLLVTLTTMRLWKLLQFSHVFRLFTRTLYKASSDLIATIVGISLFLFAFGFATEIVNGSNAATFSSYLKSVSSIMSFSFGFNSQTDPEDLSHGGQVFGFILYLLLMFVVAIFLINMFITLIIDHFTAAREERDMVPRNQLSYGEFLSYEYITNVRDFFVKRFSRRKKFSNIKENFLRKLDELDEKYQNLNRNVMSDEELYEAEVIRADRMQKIIGILKLQMEILNRELMIASLDWETDDEGDDNKKIG